MEIIAIRDVTEKSMRQFFRHWGQIEGTIKVDQGWVSIFVVDADDLESVTDYAELISIEMEKVVIYVKGQAGAVQRFCIYEHGIYCPVSKTEAEQLGMVRKNACWYLENRLAPWGVGEQDQWAIRGCIARFDTEAGPHGNQDESALSSLAAAIARAFGLPQWWQARTIDELTSDAVGKPV